MTKVRQIGGFQEVFIQVDARSIAGTERAVKAVECRGGRVVHAFPPAILVASVPAAEVGGLIGKAGIVMAETGPIGGRKLKVAEHGLGSAFAVWNEHVGVERRLRTMASPELNRAWDAPDRQPPDPPADVMERIRRREAELVPKSRAMITKAHPDSRMEAVRRSLRGRGRS